MGYMSEEHELHVMEMEARDSLDSAAKDHYTFIRENGVAASKVRVNEMMEQSKALKAEGKREASSKAHNEAGLLRYAIGEAEEAERRILAQRFRDLDY